MKWEKEEEWEKEEWEEELIDGNVVFFTFQQLISQLVTQLNYGGPNHPSISFQLLPQDLHGLGIGIKVHQPSQTVRVVLLMSTHSVGQRPLIATQVLKAPYHALVL